MKKYNKKVLLALFLLAPLSLTSCQNTPNTSSSASSESTSISTSEVETFTVTWKVEDKVVEVDENVEKGIMPHYDGETPIKAKTAKYSYTFMDWSPKLSEVVKDVTYTAEFKETINQYTATFATHGGSEIASQIKNYGEMIEKPENPTREGYKFMGWSLSLEDVKEVTFPYELKQDVTFHAIWNENIPVMKYLKKLLSGFKLSPMNYIPNTMLPTYTPNLIANKDAMTFDYSNFVSLDQINYNGYGEEWNLVVNNLKQAEIIFDLLTIVETISDASIVAFQNYFDKNPADSATHSTKVGTYDVTIKYDGEVIAYALSFAIKDKVGQIWINMDINTNARSGRIQIGDGNALKFHATENSYILALSLLNLRSSYLEINKDASGNVTGYINEHTTVKDKLDLKSAASFAFNDKRAIVVGNKVEAMPGSKPIVVETYNVLNGHLIAFEVQETISKKVYDTLWFNLDDTSGINSVKFGPNPDNKEVNRLQVPYINGSNKIFETKKGLGGLGSRYYDIELRDRYYTYKTIDEKGKPHFDTIKCEVPMMFVQETHLSTLEKDVNRENVGMNFKFMLEISEINFLTDIYHSEHLIPNFNELKELITPEIIDNFIGDKFVA